MPAAAGAASEMLQQGEEDGFDAAQVAIEGRAFARERSGSVYKGFGDNNEGLQASTATDDSAHDESQYLNVAGEGPGGGTAANRSMPSFVANPLFAANTAAPSDDRRSVRTAPCLRPNAFSWLRRTAVHVVQRAHALACGPLRISV